MSHHSLAESSTKIADVGKSVWTAWNYIEGR
jgi:hypothetical protein